jgi:RimJ/RimL family protein N-acetyltransferase
MLRGERVLLRARHEADVPILHAELHEDVVTRSRASGRAWRPIPVSSDASPYRVSISNDGATPFSVVTLAEDELAGEALLWDVDVHNRSAHLGISLRPAHRGRGLAVDVLRVLCQYGFHHRGLHRLQVETLADNAGMIRAATQAGFTREGTLRRAAWVNGEFLDEVVLGQLATEWHPN